MRHVFWAIVLLMATAVVFPAASQARAPLTDRLQAAGMDRGAAMFVRIFKQDAELEVWLEKDGAPELFETFPICHFSGDLGPKLKEGDRQSPEGFYEVGARQLNPNSQFHKSFNLGFPNRYDRAHGRTGSYLMVHGNCVSIGCYAMTDAGIDDIYALVASALEAGQKNVPVHIFPFRMTQANMDAHAGSVWIGFWRNLREGYELFERTGRVPEVRVEGRTYVFAQ